MEILQKIPELLSKVREKKPLIHHITNLVTINDCANIVLALGGSPIMAVDPKEVEEIVSMSSALVLNIGTLKTQDIESMIIAGRMANQLNIPIILDPVGVGTTNFRSQSLEKILKEIKPSVIKGNMAEIKFLSGMEVKVKGVDSVVDAYGGSDVAKNLATKLDCIIAITGKTDIVSDGKETFLIKNGHRMLSDVTGTGCMTASLIASYCGVTKDYLLAAISGVMSMGIAGERAYTSLKKDEGIGTFRYRLFDNIYNISANTILKDGAISNE